MSDHRKPLEDWLESSAQVLKDYEDWRDGLDPRDVGGLPRTSGRSDSESPAVPEAR